MNIIKESNGKWSHKRIISLCLIIVSVIMGFMLYPMEYVYFFGIAGLINIGMTVWNGIKNGKKIIGDPLPGHPPGDDDDDD